MSVRRDTAINFGGNLAITLTMIVTVPIYLRVVGEARFGVIAIVNILVAYSAFADLGIGRAVARFIAADKSDNGQSRYCLIASALSVSAVLAALALVILLLTSPYVFTHLFNLAPQLQAEIDQSRLPISLAIAIMVLVSGLGGISVGDRRFLALSAAYVSSTLGTQIFPIAIAALIGPQLNYITWGIVAGHSLLAFILLYDQRANFRKLTGKRPDLRSVKDLLRFGGWVWGGAIVNQILASADRVILSAQVGPAGVAYLSVTLSATQKLLLGQNSLASATFPRFAEKDPAAPRELLQRSLVATMLLMTPICVLWAMCGPWILQLWLGEDFARKAEYLPQILSVGVWFMALAGFPASYLQAQGKPDLYAKASWVQAVIYVPLLIYVVGEFGLIGAAMAWSCRLLVTTFVNMTLAGMPGSMRANVLFLSLPVFAGAAWSSVGDAGAAQNVLFMLVVALVLGLWLVRMAHREPKSISWLFVLVGLIRSAALRWS